MMPSRKDDMSRRDDASRKDYVERMAGGTYLGDLASRPLSDLRAMRAECQAAEVALSYVRRLVQGRLDIVHAYLARAGAADPEELPPVVDDLAQILSSGPGRPPGLGHLPLLLSPDTEEDELTAELTAELDAVLGPDDLAAVADLGSERLTSVASRLDELERKLSADRRALHERIDALQAELVERHKTGRASVDGLLT